MKRYLPFLIVIACSALLSNGCERQHSTPLSTNDITRISNGRLSVAWVDFSDGEQAILKDKSFHLMSKLIGALCPIDETSEGTIRNPEWTLTFQSGRDPDRFLVRLDGTKIQYSFGGYTYVGGRSQQFLDTIDEIIAEKSMPSELDGKSDQ